MTISELFIIYAYIGTALSFLYIPLELLLSIFLMIDYKYSKKILIFSISIPILNLIQLLTVNNNIILTVISGIVGIVIIILEYLLNRFIYIKQPNVNHSLEL